MIIDWNKPVQTRDGRKVRVLCTDGPGSLPVIGIIEGCETCSCWTLEGVRFKNYSPEHPTDLINVPEQPREIMRWASIYSSGAVHFDSAKLDAVKYRDNGCIACVPVTIKYAPGEGL